MADGIDSPPPPPSSPPPLTGSLEDLQEDVPKPDSEKFHALQRMFNSSKTMYSTPDSNRGAPPTKRHRAEILVDVEPPPGESPKLRHQTRDRPRRKTRVPSRVILREQASDSPQLDGFPGGGGDDAEIDEAPPPPPASAPPEVPSGPPPSLTDALLLPSSAEEQAPSLGPGDESEELAHSPWQMKSDISAKTDQKVTAKRDSSQVPTTDNRLNPQVTQPTSFTSSETTQVAATAQPDGDANISPSPSASEATKMAIGSFSERLKKIRSTRTTKSTSSSEMTSPLTKSTVSTTVPRLSPTKSTIPPPTMPKPKMKRKDTPIPTLTSLKFGSSADTGRITIPEEVQEDSSLPPFPESTEDTGRDSPPPPPLPSSPPPLPTSLPPDLTVPPPSSNTPNMPSMPEIPGQEDDTVDSGDIEAPIESSSDGSPEQHQKLGSSGTSVTKLIQRFESQSDIPPTLPESPPPALPTSPPPDLMKADAATTDVVIPISSQLSEEGEMEVDKYMQSATEVPEKQQSALDGFVAMDKQSLSDSRIVFSRKSDASTKPVLKRWSAVLTDEPSPMQIAEPEVGQGLGESSPPPEVESKTSVEISQNVSPIRQQEDLGLITEGNHSRVGRRRPSAPTGSSPQTVRIISEGGTLHSPDLKFTRVAKKRWSKPPQLLGDLAASASTGNIISPREDPKMQKTSSLHSFGSSSESLSFDNLKRTTSPLSPLVTSQGEGGSTKGSGILPTEDSTTADEHRSSFVESILASFPKVNLTETYSTSSSENLLGSREPVREMAVLATTGTLEATPPLQDRSKRGAGKRKGIRTVDSMITEASLHRKALEAELQGPVATELASLGQLQMEQGQLLEEQLTEMRKQQKLTQDLLQGDVVYLSEMSQDSPAPLRPPTIYLDRDVFESSPDKWSVDQVCQWLDLVGLGTYKQTFRDKQIEGGTLLHMDIQLFVDLGIDSPEIRELFLAKIYDLGNPGANSDMEDDFLLSVDSYTSDDWKKLQAAVNALKSPVLDDTIELEPSPVGEFIRSHSTANLADLDDTYPVSPGFTGTTSPNLLSVTPSHHPQGIKTSISFTNYSLPDDHTPLSRTHSTAAATNFATSPVKGRGRSLTDPTSPAKLLAGRKERETTPQAVEDEDVSESRVKMRKGDGGRPSEVVKSEGGVLELAQQLSEGTITFEDGQFKTSSGGGVVANPHRMSYWDQPSSGQEAGLIRLFMETVQEGSLYKAFLVTYSTTAEDLIKRTLDKANMNEDSGYFCIWEVATRHTGSSRVVHLSENPLRLQTQWTHFNSHRFELRFRENICQLKITVELPGKKEEVSVAMVTSTTCPEAIQMVLTRLCLPIEQSSSFAIVEVDMRISAKRVLEDSEHPAAVQSSWSEPHTHQLKLVPLHPDSPMEAASRGQDTSSLLEGELFSVRADVSHLTRLLGERNQQMHSLERDLAKKEDTIHRLRAQLEEGRGAMEQPERTSAETHLTELAASIKKERDRLQREHLTKDALIASLETDIERYRAVQSPTADEGSKISALERSLSSHEQALGSLRSEHQRQTTELKEAEEEVDKLRLSLLEKEHHHSQTTRRPSLYSMLSPRVQCIITTEVEPTEQGLGIKVANEPSAIGGCVVKGVANSCKSSQLKPGDRLLEINGNDVSSKTHKEVGEFLHNCHKTVKLVVSRPLPPEVLDGENFPDSYGVGSPSGMVIERFKKLNASLNSQLDTQSAETEQWRRECESLKAEVLMCSTSQKDKESEMKLLQSTIQDLKQQLEESEKSRTQLRETFAEVENTRHHQQSKDLDTSLREREREVAKLKAAEREKLKQLKATQKERDNAIRALRQCAVSDENLEVPDLPLESESLTHASQSKVLSALTTVEEELQRHKAYLDQLLSIIVDQSPELLGKMGEAQRMRDHMESDSWC